MRLRRRTFDRPDHATRATDPEGTELDELHERLERLEAAFEGLQDAVHRESVRQDKQVHDLIRNTQPAAVARALSDDARRRGV
jgi:hypothetical protein